MVNWQTFLSVFATIFLAETRALKFAAGFGFHRCRRVDTISEVITDAYQVKRMARPHVAYIGVGLMGLPMVKRLVSLDYGVTAYDILPEKTQAARTAGAQAAQSPADAVGTADLVVLNLPTP